MSVLPARVPPAIREELEAALDAHGLTLGPLMEGSRITHLIRYQGQDWRIVYGGPMHGESFWALYAPGVEHGVAAFTAGVFDVLNGGPGY